MNGRPESRRAGSWLFRVLILDDDLRRTASLGTHFRALVCAVESARGREEAERRLRDAPPDALVVALGLPGISTAWVAERRRRGLAVLAIVPAEHPIDDALAAGVTALLPESYTQADLVEVSAELLLAVRPPGATTAGAAPDG